jgi:hypothetical protein
LELDVLDRVRRQQPMELAALESERHFAVSLRPAPRVAHRLLNGINFAKTFRYFRHAMPEVAEFGVAWRGL